MVARVFPALDVGVLGPTERGRPGSDPDVARVRGMLGGDALAGEIAMVLKAPHLRLRIVDAVLSLAFAAQQLYDVYLQPVCDRRFVVDVSDCFRWHIFLFNRQKRARSPGSHWWPPE